MSSIQEAVAQDLTDLQLSKENLLVENRRVTDLHTKLQEAEKIATDLRQEYATAHTAHKTQIDSHNARTAAAIERFNEAIKPFKF